MFIDCYMFSDIALKPKHTYYNIDDYKLLLYNLKDYRIDSLRVLTFIYKVKVDSDDVHYLGKYGVMALKYQVIEEVPFGDFIKELPIEGLLKAELMSISKGSMSKDKVIKKYEKIINKDFYSLTYIQIFKLHAILSQKKYDLPIFYVDRQDWRYVRVLEYYGRKYEVKYTLRGSIIYYIERERILGSKNFEDISIPEEATVQIICELIEGRKLTQEQFEKYCDVFMTSLEYDDKKYLAQKAIFSNYELPYKYKDIFLPSAVFKYPNWITELTDEHIDWWYADVTSFLMIGYKVKDGKYNLKWADSIMNARKILNNTNYKYIEIKSNKVKELTKD